MKILEADRKHWSEKEKLLVTRNFFFSYSVFKRLVLQTRKNQGLFGKGLSFYYTITTPAPTPRPRDENAFWKHCGNRSKCW